MTSISKSVHSLSEYLKSDSDLYSDKCAEILERFCTNQVAIPKTPSIKHESNTKDKSWALKGAMCVFRHADRTPKMKLKFNIKGAWPWSKPFISLLQGRQDEIILREDEQLRYIEAAADEAMAIEGADTDMLNSLKKILNKKIGVSGTKAQLKPSFGEDGHCEKLNIIVKWGGEFTHAGRYQSRDLGENFRKDYAILNKSLLKNATICSSSEYVSSYRILLAFVTDAMLARADAEPLRRPRFSEVPSWISRPLLVTRRHLTA